MGEEVTRPPPHVHLLPPSAPRPYPQSSDLPNVKHNKQLAAHQASIHHRCLCNHPSSVFLHIRATEHTYTTVRSINTNRSVKDLY